MNAALALEVDGHLKTSFETLEAATKGAQEIKRRFPTLQVKIYESAVKARLDFKAWCDKIWRWKLRLLGTGELMAFAYTGIQSSRAEPLQSVAARLLRLISA